MAADSEYVQPPSPSPPIQDKATTDTHQQTTNRQFSVYVQSWLLMGYCRGKLDTILGVTGGKTSTTRSYKSAALPTELRQPKSDRDRL